MALVGMSLATISVVLIIFRTIRYADYHHEYVRNFKSLMAVLDPVPVVDSYDGFRVYVKTAFMKPAEMVIERRKPAGVPLEVRKVNDSGTDMNVTYTEMRYPRRMVMYSHLGPLFVDDQQMQYPFALGTNVYYVTLR